MRNCVRSSTCQQSRPDQIATGKLSWLAGVPNQRSASLHVAAGGAEDHGDRGRHPPDAGARAGGNLFLTSDVPDALSPLLTDLVIVGRKAVIP